MDYVLARYRIKTGDLIAVRDQRTVLERLTAWVTSSPYTHTGVAVWLGERLFMADLNTGRNHLTAVSCLQQFDVYAPPQNLARDLIEDALFNWLAKPIDYGFAAFIVIGLKCMLHLKVFIHWRKIVVCSGGSVEIYEKAAAAARDQRHMVVAGWQEHDRMLSPGELAAELQLKFPVG